MRRDDPSPTLPAWLQEPQSTETAPPVRRGFRRAGRDDAAPSVESPLPRSENTADLPQVVPTAVPGQLVRETVAVPVPSVPLASVPLGTLSSAGPATAPLPAPVAPPGFAASSEPAAPSVPAESPEPEVPGDPEEESPVEVPVDRPRVPEPEPAPCLPESGAPDLDLRVPEEVTDHTRMHGSPDHRPSNIDLASGVLVRRSRRSRNWREGVHKLTGGLLDPSGAGSAARHEELAARIRQPIAGDYRIAVLSLKGGVGKTTTTIGLGSTFASLRGDCVIAVDANPDFGTLAQRVPQQTTSTVRDLLANASGIRRYSDVRAHTSQAPSRLEVLASERDPAASEAFSEDDYRRVVDILQVFYNIVLTDCGTGIMHSAMRGVLELTNALVLVASPAVDGARSAAATLDWLQVHGYGELVERTVVVISSPRPGSSTIDMAALTEHFLARCRAVEVLPFDEHLAEGAEIHLERLRPATRRAFVELAALVADDFPAMSGRHAAR